MPAHDDFRIALEAWTETLLRPYIEHLETHGTGKTSKEFNDPVWSTIVLRPLEVAILDSPLLQRLRMIRQLGLVHLVYPAANHTRLEHSIGVVTQIDRLVESINEHFANRGAAGVSGEESGRAVSDDLRNVLRLTALCHDVGHGAMSHVSENALGRNPKVSRIREEFSDAFGEEEVALSEIAAYYVVGSAAFKNLLEAAVAAVDERHMPRTQEAIKRMGQMIIGATVDDDIPLLHELMSGPFDADKLDYMTRDALMTGVPVVTDTARLVQKIRAVRVSEERLPEKVGDTVKKRESYIMTGIGMSGARTLDELMFGRVLLYDKLYRHHKVRAAEAMVASIFRQVAPVVEEGPALAPFKLVDHELLELDRRAVRRLAGKPLSEQQRKSADVATELASMLKRRELFVRAFAFALDMPQDPYHSEPGHFEGLTEVMESTDDPEFLDDLVKRITTALGEICDALAPELVEKYNGDFEPYLAVDPPMPAPDGTDATHAYLISEGAEDGGILAARPGIAGTAKWSEAYLLTRETGFVFTTEELAPYAFLASELVFRRDYEIRIPKTMYIYAKLDEATIEENKRILDERGFFDALPSDLAPLPRQLLTASAGKRIRKVLANLRGYEGPRTSRSDKGPLLLGEQRVIDWLKQFGSKFGDEPLKLLEELQLVGREQVVAALEGFMASTGGRFASASICPLGTAKDSSAITTYYAGDLGDVPIRSVPDALVGDDPIVFIDDFIGSGQQSVSILEAWFGEKPSTDLHEERGAPLNEMSQSAMRARPLGFVFASGQAAGATRLRQALERLGLKGEVFLADDRVAPQAVPRKPTPARQELLARCREVGLQLLDDGNQRHDPEWREQRALGYGNEAFLVAFPYNTPTQTLTCLWHSGQVDGVDWTALIPRRAKS
jgi:HD superfamily phosphohydrolase